MSDCSQGPLTKLPVSNPASTLARWPHAGIVHGPSTWIGPGQIYVKLLPDGEPVQLIHADDAKRPAADKNRLGEHDVYLPSDELMA